MPEPSYGPQRVDCAARVFRLPLRITVFAGLCLVLLACSDNSQSSSAEGGADRAAVIGGDGAPLPAMDAPMDRGGTSTGAGDGDVLDAPGPSDATNGPTAADSATTKSGDDAAPEAGADATLEAGADATLEAGADATLEAGGDAAPEAGDAAGPGPVAGDAAGDGPTAATAYFGNPAHTNSVDDPSLAPPLAPIWSFDPAVGVSPSYPLIAGGRVYFVYGAKMVALDEHTGATLWGPVDVTPSPVGQAYDGERIFTVDSAGLVRAFDAATGQASWTQGIVDSSPASPQQPTAYRGVLYVAAAGVVTALDETTGKIAWTAPLGSAFQTSPAVTDDGVFVALGCQNVYAFDRTTGSILWHHSGTSCSGTGGVAQVYSRHIFVTELEPTPEHTDVYDALNGGLVATLPCFIASALDEGRAYCNQRTPLTDFDLTTGAQGWTFFGDKQLNLAPFAAGGTVYVASDTGMMFGVDESTGALSWQIEADSLGASGSTVAGEGVLLTQLYGAGGVVAYAHVVQPDAGVVVGDAAAPTPSTLISSGHPLSLALDGTNVYWADSSAGQISLAPKTGGSPVVLWSSSTTSPVSVAVDATNVYFVASGDGQTTPSAIMAVPIAGGTASTLASSMDALDGPFAVGPSLVYWMDGAVQAVPKAGGAATTVVQAAATALAVDASNLYWAATDGVHAEPLAGRPGRLLGVPPNPEPMALGPQGASAIAVDGTNVYYGMNSEAGPANIGYMPIAGGATTVLASGRLGRVMAIAVDERNVYWVEGEGTIQQGAIAAVPKTGGEVTVLVSGLSDPMTVAVDSSGVYFPSAGGGIGKIAK